MDLASRLQLRAGQRVAVLDAPPDVAIGVPAGVSRVDDPAQADAVIAFVRDHAALTGPAAEEALAAARADRLAWIAYPKAGQLDTDLNRDRLAAALAGTGTRPVRQVSIDPVWSALRFRPA
ncbi:MAG TPA: hypothetical protein VFR67_29295 [Pilimelia sp.]|nr:hypothetical protein [Pilimelia sp.]